MIKELKERNLSEHISGKEFYIDTVYVFATVWKSDSEENTIDVVSFKKKVVPFSPIFHKLRNMDAESFEEYIQDLQLKAENSNEYDNMEEFIIMYDGYVFYTEQELYDHIKEME